MTISSTDSRVPYSGNGVTVAFSVPFRFFANTDLVVILRSTTGVDTTLTLTTHYTVVGAGNDAGGTLTMVTPPAVGEMLVIYRSVSLTQEVDYQSGDSFPAETHEQALDRLTMIAQQHQLTVDRALRFPLSDSASPVLPNSVSRAGKLLGFDSDGVPVATLPATDSAADVRIDLASTDSGNGANLVGSDDGSSGSMWATVAGFITYAMARLNWTVNVFKFMTLAQIADVQAKTYAIDVTAAVQSAIDAAAARGQKLKIPAGGYKLTPATVKTDEAGSNTCALQMRSNMHIDAEPGAVFRIADGVSTDGSPKRMSMFFSNEVLTDISIVGLTMDMNGANNKISPLRPSTYSLFTQAHIIFSGTPGGVAARGERVFIDRCKFLNTPGVSCIVMCQSNSNDVVISKGWTVSNNLFENNGLDTSDHSSVFGWADDVLSIGNTYTSDVMVGTVGLTGGQVAHEVAGANHRIIGNKVKNYYQGNWVAANFTSATDGTIISGNTIGPIRAIGVGFFRETANSKPVQNTIISDNTFIITDDVAADPLKCAVKFLPTYQTNEVSVKNNRLTKLGTATPACFMSIANQSIAGQVHDGIRVQGNESVNTALGVSITSSIESGLGRISIIGNSFKDLASQGTYSTKFGVIATGNSQITSLVSQGNVFENLASTLDYGNYVTGIFNSVKVDGNTYVGVGTKYAEASATIASRSGDDVLRGSGLLPAATGLPTGSAVSVNVTVPGVLLGDFATASSGTSLSGFGLSAVVVAADTVTVTAMNQTGVVVNVPAMSVFVIAKKK